MKSQRDVSGIKKIFMAGAALYLVCPALSGLMNPNSLATSIETREQRHARNTSAFAVMIGEFRTSIGDMLFIKTERYLDSGVGYEPHVDAREIANTDSADLKTSSLQANLDAELMSPEMKEALAIKPGDVSTHAVSHDGHDHEAHEHEDHAHHDHEGHDHEEGEGSSVKTLILTADEDFRGFIGSLERQVKPWRSPTDPHQHTAGTELLPWYRLATLSDPHNVRNYFIGAYWLKTLRTPEQLNESMKFLNEGIAANPEAYELYLMKGYVLYEMEKLEEARTVFRKSADIAIKHRPPGGPDSTPNWDVTDDEQMSAAMTMDVMLTRDLESTATAILATHEYMRRMPEAGALKRMLGELESGN